MMKPYKLAFLIKINSLSLLILGVVLTTVNSTIYNLKNNNSNITYTKTLNNKSSELTSFFDDPEYENINVTSDGKFDLSYVPQYKKYNYASIEQGDYIFQATGFFGLTGHIAEFLGWTTDIHGYNFGLVAEALPEGMKYGVLDDERIEKEEATVLHIKNASSQQRINSINFIEKQINKRYILVPYLYSIDENDDGWYCSEVVWASWMHQNINLDDVGKTSGITKDMFVYPRNLRDSNNVYKIINYKN